MTLDEVEVDAVYECLINKQNAPVAVQNILAANKDGLLGGVVGINLNTMRQVFIKNRHIHRIGNKLANSSREWKEKRLVS